MRFFAIHCAFPFCHATLHTGPFAHVPLLHALFSVHLRRYRVIYDFLPPQFSFARWVYMHGYRTFTSHAFLSVLHALHRAIDRSASPWWVTHTLRSRVIVLHARLRSFALRACGRSSPLRLHAFCHAYMMRTRLVLLPHSFHTTVCALQLATRCTVLHFLPHRAAAHDMRTDHYWYTPHLHTHAHCWWWMLHTSPVCLCAAVTRGSTQRHVHARHTTADRYLCARSTRLRGCLTPPHFTRHARTLHRTPFYTLQYTRGLHFESHCTLSTVCTRRCYAFCL